MSKMLKKDFKKQRPPGDNLSNTVISAAMPRSGSTLCPIALQGSQFRVYSASREELVRISRYCPGKPYIELQVPGGLEEIHRIEFITRSHDQGFCGEPEFVGTYEGSYTWFEASVSTPAGLDRIPRNLIQCNVTANSEFKTHTITWDLCTADESQRQWIGRIQSGDIIRIIPRAQWKCWVNYVESARIDLHCRMIKAAISSTTMPAKDLTQTVRAIQNDYQHYQKLDRDRQELRLLVLQPGLLEDPICCYLITSSLTKSPAPVFEALSYCWGNMADTRKIKLSHTSTLESSAQHQVFAITSSLHGALRHLRHSDGRSRTLWVDSVCINQSDLQERGAQVDMMGDIYSRADLVCVWLGESDAASTRAMALIRDVSDRDLHWGAQYGEDSRTAYYKILKDISQLFNYPWFGRVWVLQEVWKACKAIASCGNDTVPWESIIQTNLWMLEAHGGGFPGFNLHTLPSIWTKLAGVRNLEVEEDARKRNPGVGQEIRNIAQTSEQLPCLELLDLILESISLNATDPRDKIYSLLGMCQETQGTNPTPLALRSDYTKTTSETFVDFTRWWILKHKSLVILSAIHALTGRTWQELGCSASSMSKQSTLPVDHPSWALWHEGDGRWAKRTLGMSRLYKAAGNTLVSLESSDITSSQLSLTGLRIGVVASTHRYPFYKAEEDELYGAYIRLFDPAGSYGTWNFGNTNDQLRKEEEKVLYMDHYFSHWDTPPDTLPDEVPWDTRGINFGNRWSFPCHGTPLFRTSDGSLGLCPPKTQPNDIIVILCGGPVPFILRAREECGRQLDMTVQYEFIGECYLQDYMHGAAIEHQQRCNIPLQQFVLV
ncbi:HET-domain-containing protein [Hyaloscypha bicolor E]|uniref:HET-domain-containing protein n=1 Tax=Hyaloscypha bicolor E TaxID=1095630 RepID=A0A2J6SS43_9HELO|nr:HET-domain-containing protein [Hyaloscypha bicolor E]PMD53601.1 HET-domain-containing protein [Hyaloscypha bicolor E]